MTVLPEHECSYLPNRRATSRAVLTSRLPPLLYHDLMDAGFRRSGKLIYQPVCRGCRECRPIRVPVQRFRSSKSQRRCIRRNADLHVSIEPAQPSDEKFSVYLQYMAGWHAAPRDSRSQFESFLYDSPVDTIDFTYRDALGRLLAVGICDVCNRSLSSVYFYFQPAESRRGLGTFGAITEIECARSRGIPYYYLGYWIRGCRTMSYKNLFRPNEILCTDGVWRELGRVPV